MAESHGAEVTLRGLSRDYGEIAAVQDLDLTVAPVSSSPCWALSGSGKTTTLMMVAGFVHPTAGDIRLDGQSILTPPRTAEPRGRLPELRALPAHAVFDNVAFPLRMRRLSAGVIRERVEDGPGLVQLGPLGARRIQELSGGQQQRVALARALVVSGRPCS